MSANGGPAFPRRALLVENQHQWDVQDLQAQSGMSLLDYFAGQALANNNIQQFDGAGWSVCVAEQAYAIAEAMLAEKAKREAKP